MEFLTCYSEIVKYLENNNKVFNFLFIVGEVICYKYWKCVSEILNNFSIRALYSYALALLIDYIK